MQKKSPKRKKSSDIVQRIVNDIESGVYAVGSPLPTLRDLSLKYSANPQTINKAILYLNREGYVHSRQGSRSLVSLRDEKRSERVIGMMADRQKSKLIALDSQDDYHCKDVYLSYLGMISHEGLRPCLLSFDEQAKEVDPNIEKSVAGLTGLIVQGSLPQCYFDFFAKIDLPLVLINRRAADSYSGRVGTIHIPNTKLSEALNLLIATGHNKILYSISSEFEKCVVFDERLQYVKNAALNWLPSVDIDIQPFSFMPDSPEARNELYELYNRGFSSAICDNDVTALRLYKVLQGLDRKIPIDFSVIGFGDFFSSRIAIPPLTTVHVDISRTGEIAFRMMDELLNAEAPYSIEESLSTELIIRNSVIKPS